MVRCLTSLLTIMSSYNSDDLTLIVEASGSSLSDAGGLNNGDLLLQYQPNSINFAGGKPVQSQSHSSESLATISSLLEEPDLLEHTSISTSSNLDDIEENSNPNVKESPPAETENNSQSVQDNHDRTEIKLDFYKRIF